MGRRNSRKLSRRQACPRSPQVRSTRETGRGRGRDRRAQRHSFEEGKGIDRLQTGPGSCQADSCAAVSWYVSSSFSKLSIYLLIMII